MTAISSATSLDRAVGGAGANRFSEIASEDFIKIIFTELTNQDPLQPNDTSALLDQLNSIRSIESDLQLGKQLEKIVTQNQLAAASTLIGRTVGGLTAGFDRVAGTVIAAAQRDGEVLLQLDGGQVMPIESVETIYDPELAEPTGRGI